MNSLSLYRLRREMFVEGNMPSLPKYMGFRQKSVKGVWDFFEKCTVSLLNSMFFLDRIMC